jgi:hypothetical protein
MRPKPGFGENRYAYVGNNPVGHSLGGRAALAVALQLVEECRFAPDHLFTIDPFEAPDVKAPPGVPTTNFYQRRSWWFTARAQEPLKALQIYKLITRHGPRSASPSHLRKLSETPDVIVHLVLENP